MIGRLKDTAAANWGAVLILACIAVFIASGAPTAPLFVLAAIVAFLFAVRYPYAAFYAGILLTPFLGLMVSISTGNLLIGERAFGGSIDISLGEVVMMLALAAWGIRLITLWWKRRDQAWRPHLPLGWSALGLFAAHIVSVFSPLQPDPLPVLKFAVRPVLFDYLAYVALPVNFIRSRRRLRVVLGCFALLGTLAAANGVVGMFIPSPDGITGRAHPSAIFGVSPLGDNQNALADLLIVTVPLTLALAELQGDGKYKRELRLMAVFQLAVGLLCFTRTFWVLAGLALVALWFTEWRDTLKKHLSLACLVGLLLLPLGLAMVAYSVSRTAQSSNSTRSMLTAIATEVFQTSPWIGGGAGTFLNDVGSTRVFLIEYGDPLDSHGIVQKLAAETGIVGLVAFAVFLLLLVRLLWRGYQAMPTPERRRAFALIALAALLGIAYQFFNTDYWTGKMWLPIGVALAAAEVLRQIEVPRDILAP